MTENNETSSSADNLTDGSAVQESSGESSESNEVTEVANSDKIIAGFKKDQQKSREREKALKEELEKFREAQKAKAQSEMSEVDRLTSIARDEAEKRGRLEMTVLVEKALKGRNLSPLAEELLLSAPWRIKPVLEDIGENATIDEAISSLKRNLSDYLDQHEIGSNQVAQPTTEEEPIQKVDSERSVSEPSVVKTHTYTNAEIQAIYKDQAQWAKHREAIMKQIADAGGSLPVGI